MFKSIFKKQTTVTVDADMVFLTKMDTTQLIDWINDKYTSDLDWLVENHPRLPENVSYMLLGWLESKKQTATRRPHLNVSKAYDYLESVGFERPRWA